jgi:hypothetical protein
MLIAFIVGFIITAISFTLGIGFTLFLSKNDIYERVMDRLPQKPPEVHLGTIERLTQKELSKSEQEEEGEEEMSKELRKFYKK